MIAIITYSAIFTEGAQFKFHQLNTKNGLSSDYVYAVAVKDKTVWFGTYGGGVSRYDKSTQAWKIYTTKGENLAKHDDGDTLVWKNLPRYMEITSITVDGDLIWFGSDFYGKGGGGISSFDIKNGKWTLYNTGHGLVYKKVISLASDGKYLWVGTQRGISRLDKEAKKFAIFRVSGNYINCILPLHDSVWFATNAGISRMLKATGKITNYGARDGLPDSEAKSIVAIEKELWAGFSNGILARFDLASNKWQVFTSNDTLSTMPVHSILHSNGRIYVNRDGGISVYEIAEKKWFSLTEKDGLEATSVFSSFPDNDGIWFGTDRGAYKLILK